MSRDLSVIGAEAEMQRQRQRQQAFESARLEHILQREKEEAARRLESLLQFTHDDGERLRIQQALESRNVDRMQALLEELQPQVTRKSPDERLRLLLEPLKEYAGEDEIRSVEAEALADLQAHGFRQARETVVRYHDLFRARYRKAVEEESPSTTEQRVDSTS